jgi:dsRNA-specific ribonuclease
LLSLPALLEAMTPRLARDSFNFERYEWIGDSFLKLAVSAHLFKTRPFDHQGMLTSGRSAYISNCKLIQSALSSGVIRYLRASSIGDGKTVLRNLFPQKAVSCQQCGTKDEQLSFMVSEVTVKGKTAADFFESLLGCCYIHGLQRNI